MTASVITVILTNGRQEQPEAKLAHLGLLGRLGPVLAAEGLGVDKLKPKRKKTRSLGHVRRVVASQLGSAGRSRPQRAVSRAPPTVASRPATVPCGRAD
jgi:hypothetical protein